MEAISVVCGQDTLVKLQPNERPACMFSMLPSMINGTPSPKISKNFKENSPEIFNCKRRLDFNNHVSYLSLQRPHTVSVARRNERERNRVKLINMTFASLREHIPSGVKAIKSKKMSKVETLRSAIEYIRYLQTLVDESDAVNAVFDTSCLKTGMSPTASIDSPSPSSYSESSYERLSAEEEDLLDFANWF